MADQRPQGHDVRMRATSEDTPLVKVLKEYAQSKQIADPFIGAYGVSGGSWQALHEPPFSFYALMQMPRENSILSQCIDAMVTNIDGHGYRLEYTGEDEKGETSSAAVAERKILEDLLNFPNDDYSMQELRDRIRRDYETIGNAYIEIARDARGRVVMLSHLPAHTVRLSNRDWQATEVEITLPRDGGKEMKRKVQKRFRRFVQMVGNRRVYFKEYGDPRLISPDNGEVMVETGKAALAASATEIIHLCPYNPSSPYGLPRWFNQITSILGTRQAEMVNLDFFRDNAIPAMMLMVSGGAVTQGSLDAISDHFNTMRGRGSMQRILVIEATGDTAAGDENGKIPPPKVELKPLVNERQTDATFLEYDKSGMDKIRSSFRIPPLFVGRSEDMTYATAKTSYEVAEGQVFAPERQRFDDMLNLRVLSTYMPKYWEFRSNPPRLSDSDALVTALTAFDTAGALSPNIAIGIANELFDLSIAPVDEDWGDYPFAMTEALIAAGKLKVDLQNAEPPAPVAPGMPGAPKLGPDGKPIAPKPGAALPGAKPKDPTAAADTGKPKEPTLTDTGGKKVPDKKPATTSKGIRHRARPGTAKLTEATTKAMMELHKSLTEIRDEE